VQESCEVILKKKEKAEKLVSFNFFYRGPAFQPFDIFSKKKLMLAKKGLPF
jgi:hypothetical protein